MPVCKKYSNRRAGCFITHIYISCLVFILPCAGFAGTNNISVTSADGVIIENMYTVNAQISYQLGKESRDALEHGIPLEFDVDFRIRKQRSWLWDQTLIHKTISYRLEHQPLSGDFLVTRLNNGDLEQFQKLEDALGYIGKISDFPLADSGLLESGDNLYAQVKSRLNIEALPAPLRPLAYISGEWRLSSPWQSWSVKK